MRLGQISFVSFLSQILAAVLGFVATVLITRNLGSEVFGTYALIVAVVIWLKTIAIMGIRSAMVKRLSEEGDTGEYAVAAALLLGGILTVLSVILLVAAEPIDTYIGQPASLIIVVLTWTTAAVAFASGLLQGTHFVHYASALKPLETGVRSGVQIAVIFAGVGLYGLLAGFGLGALIAAIVGVLVVKMMINRPARRHFVELINYARFAWLGRMSNRTFASIDTVILGLFVSVGLIGIYEVAWNLASILAVFGTAITQTLFPEMSRVASQDGPGEVANLLERGLAYAGLLLIPGFIGAVVVGDLVLYVYGNEFTRGHTVLVLLVFARLLYAYANQLLTALNGLDRPEAAFRVNAVFLVANVCLNLLLVAAFSWIGAAVATLISAGLALGLALRQTHVIVDSFVVPVGELGRQLLAAGVMGVVVYSLRRLLPGIISVGIGLVGLGAVVYIFVLLGVSPRFRETVRDNVMV